MKSNVRERELEKIDGIAKKRSQWLHEANIDTFPELLSIPAQNIKKPSPGKRS